MSSTIRRRGASMVPQSRRQGNSSNLPPPQNVVVMIESYSPEIAKGIFRADKTKSADGKELSASFAMVRLMHPIPELGIDDIETDENGIPQKIVKLEMPTPPNGEGRRRNLLGLSKPKGQGAAMLKGSLVAFEKVTKAADGTLKAFFSHGGPSKDQLESGMSTMLPMVYSCVPQERRRKNQDGQWVWSGRQDLFVADHLASVMVVRSGEPFVQLEGGEKLSLDFNSANAQIDEMNAQIQEDNAAAASEDGFEPQELTEASRGNLLAFAVRSARFEADQSGQRVSRVVMNFDDAVDYVVAANQYGSPGFQMHARYVVSVPDNASAEQLKDLEEQGDALAANPDSRVAAYVAGWDVPRKDANGNFAKDPDTDRNIYDPINSDQLKKSFWDNPQTEDLKQIWESGEESVEFELVPMSCMTQGTQSLVPSRYTGDGVPHDNSQRYRVIEELSPEQQSKKFFYDWKKQGDAVPAPTRPLNDGRVLGPVDSGWVLSNVGIARFNVAGGGCYGNYQQPMSLRYTPVPLADLPTPGMTTYHRKAADNEMRRLLALKGEYMAAGKTPKPTANEEQSQDAGPNP